MITQCRLITRVLAVVFLFISVSSGYGQLEDCKCMPIMRPEDPWGIVDTVEWDTCGTNLGNSDCRQVVLQLRGDDFKNRMYGRGPWAIQFKDSAFIIAPAPEDTVLYVDWRTINPRYNALKNALGELEYRFGSIQLEKTHPHIVTGEGSQLYLLRFQTVNTVPAYTVDSVIARLPDIKFGAMYFGVYFLESVPRSIDVLTELNIELTVDGHLIVECSLPRMKSRVASLVNGLGEVLLEFTIDPVSPTYIDVSRFPKGVYFVSSGTSFGKFIISR